MNAILDWLNRLRPSRSPAEPPASTLLRARGLAREGRADEASKLLWKIPRKHLTAEILVEHAELLMQQGDHFGAASRAALARERDPQDTRAAAIQRRILKLEEEERRRT